jgi:Helix-turn-helix domain
MRKTQRGKAYGRITAKAYQVLGALLHGFHNSKSGACWPSYERIMQQADCARSTVAEAIKALEECGILSWVNRIIRVREADGSVRVLRTSNSYHFFDVKTAKSEKPTGTPNQVLKIPATATKTSSSQLELALARLGEAVKGHSIGGYKPV